MKKLFVSLIFVCALLVLCAFSASATIYSGYCGGEGDGGGGFTYAAFLIYNGYDFSHIVFPFHGVVKQIVSRETSVDETVSRETVSLALLLRRLDGVVLTQYAFLRLGREKNGPG